MPGSQVSVIAPLDERVAWWSVKGEHGVSSFTIFCAMTGSTESPLGEFGYPYDPDDFRRCKQLLDLFPEWRSDLARVAARFPWFKPFVARWSRFENFYGEESSTGKCPRLYEAMQTAARLAERLLQSGVRP